MRRLAIISGFDSQFKWGVVLGKRFEAAGYSLEFFCPTVRSNQITDSQLETYGAASYPIHFVSKDKLFSSSLLLEFDVVLFSLPAGLTEEGTLRLADSWQREAAQHPGVARWNRRPLLVAGFVGVNYENRIGAMASRRLVDVLLANSDAEGAFFRSHADRLGFIQPRVITAGLGLIESTQHRHRAMDGQGSRRLLFAAQPTVPKTRIEKVYLLLKLIELAKRQPEWEVAIKPRHRRGEETFHRDSGHLETLLEEYFDQDSLPSNLRVDHRPIVQQLAATDLLLTVSSTAALEAYAYGVAFGILTDFGIKEPYGAEFFADCGALTTFDELGAGSWPVVEPEWVDKNVAYADQHFHALLDTIDELARTQEAEGRMLPFGDAPYDKARRNTIEFIEGWRAASSPTAMVRSLLGNAEPGRWPWPPFLRKGERWRMARRSIVRKAHKLLRDPKAFVRDSWILR